MRTISSDGNNYSDLDVNSEQHQEHAECVMCATNRNHKN